MLSWSRYRKPSNHSNCNDMLCLKVCPHFFFLTVQAEEVNTMTDPWTAVRVSPNSKTLNVDGQTSTQIEIKGLAKNTFYQVKVKAVNRIGSSDETTFIFKTGAGGGWLDVSSFSVCTLYGFKWPVSVGQPWGRGGVGVGGQWVKVRRQVVWVKVGC